MAILSSAIKILLTALAAWVVVSCLNAESYLAPGILRPISRADSQFEMKRAERGSASAAAHLLFSADTMLSSSQPLPVESIDEILAVVIYATRAGVGRQTRISTLWLLMRKEGCALFDNPKMQMLALESQKRDEPLLWTGFSTEKCPNER